MYAEWQFILLPQCYARADIDNQFVPDYNNNLFTTNTRWRIFKVLIFILMKVFFVLQEW